MEEDLLLCHKMNSRNEAIEIEPLQHSTYKVFAPNGINLSWKLLCGKLFAKLASR